MKSIVGLAHVLIGNVSVDLRSRNIAVPQQRLDRTRVGSVLEQVSGKAVPKGVRRDV